MHDFVFVGKQIPKHLDHMFRMEQDVKTYEYNLARTARRGKNELIGVAHKVDVKANSEGAMFIKELNEMKLEMAHRQRRLEDLSKALPNKSPEEIRLESLRKYKEQKEKEEKKKKEREQIIKQERDELKYPGKKGMIKCSF